jgi:alginate O-acetyltransferase complex protein AlgI
MLFNSTLFLQFFAAFLLLYYVIRNHLQARNILIIIASYVFYGAWDYRFLFLLLFSSLLDFYIGRALGKTEDTRRRKFLLSVSVICSLTILGFFKYFDFFTSSLADLMNVFGVNVPHRALGILLPVGISFYTFQSMSYAIDVYRRHFTPTNNLINFLAYVAFFPQLVAGPINRAGHLLPQFSRTLEITLPMLREGLWLCVWGLFKKVVIADNLAPLAELAYNHPAPGGPVIILGTVAFAFQIYCDFSGYSDIARGVARLLGFDLMVNFNLPYTATNIREFWQRWHISLSTWLRDYVYIPLGGNRHGPARTAANLLITMLLGGFWHGAKWTFLLWGAWHGLGLVVHRIFHRPNQQSGPLGWLLTMLFVFFGWLLFRADSLRHALALISQLATTNTPIWFGEFVLVLILFSLPLIISEIYLRKHPIANFGWPTALLEGACLIAILLFWERAKTPFIYFQF